MPAEEWAGDIGQVRLLSSFIEHWSIYIHMCGIAGIVHLSGSVDATPERVAAMLSAQEHRGPDSGGLTAVSCDEPVAVFGHRRLAIIDLTEAGHQPMRDPATGNWITFNGEIYNYRELREDLRASGHEFRTESDTEVLLKSYAVWGKDCAKYLRGIFAFAIWDAGAGQLVLIRDHLGVKPLYYWQQRDRIVFASEVRAILASNLVPRTASMSAIQSYLAYGSVQEPYTLVQDVVSLEPGHALTWARGRTELSRYWRLPSAQEARISAEPTAIHSQLLEAVRAELIADVPLGAFLSGGIDSTAITSLMKESGAAPLRTFSVVFDEERYDERKYARLAAAHIGTEHTEMLLTGNEVRSTLPQALAAFDQPSVDGLNTYFVSRATKEAGLTVALSGAGGDEVFAGYNGFRKALLAEAWGSATARIPPVVRGGAARVLEAFPLGGERRRKAADLLRSTAHPYFTSRRLFSSTQVDGLISRDVADSAAAWRNERFVRIEDEAREYDPVNRASAFEIQTYLLSTLLRDSDQMSMAHALEVRVPFLDHTVVEYMARIPGRSKIDASNPKPLLTKALGSGIPSECIYRPKRGFELPFAVWLQSSMRERCEASFLDAGNASALPFTSNALQRLWVAFQHGQIGWSRVWGVFVLRDWMSRHRVAIA